jgi:hypothetical protein
MTKAVTTVLITMALIDVLPAGAAPAMKGVKSSAAASDHLRAPVGYRATYQALGTWAVAADKGPGAKQMHMVYASPGAIAAFRKAGHFADGTILVKEVYDADTAPMTTGTVSRAGALKGWFVMIKDSKNAHPGNPLWGDGWGWSWFDAGAPTRTTTTNYANACKGCHIPARGTDWIYTQGYPILKH